MKSCAQGPDAKKEEFRSYLTRSGVIDALTKGACPVAARAGLASSPNRAPPFPLLAHMHATHAVCFSLLLLLLASPLMSAPASPLVLAASGAMMRAVLVALYEEPEKPQNAIEFIKLTLGAPTGTDVDALKAENEALRVKAEELEKQLADLKSKLPAEE